MNIVHCDLKPENILLTSDADFPQVYFHLYTSTKQAEAKSRFPHISSSSNDGCRLRSLIYSP